MQSLGDLSPTTRTLQVFNVEYTSEYDKPIVHLFCRDRSGEFHWVEVEGHRPSFYIRREQFNRRVKNDQWVHDAEHGHESIHGDELTKLYTKLPKHVGGTSEIDGLRERFDETWEADIFYTTRFLIDTGIKTHFEFDVADTTSEHRYDGDYRIHVDDIEATDVDWHRTPKTVTIDIEVLADDGFPEPSDAAQPVTAITAYDNYSEQYRVWALKADGWDSGRLETHVESTEWDVTDCTIYEDEGEMLESFNSYIRNQRPDFLSGWNSSSTSNGSAFDYPYLMNRCENLNVFSHNDWSPMGTVWQSGWGPNGKGVEFYDMMKAYEKTLWSEPDGGMGLDNIASIELERGKDDIEDIDTAYYNDPQTFLEYNIRDVEAVIEIDNAAGVTNLYQNLRKLTGAQFDNLHNNIDLLDTYILRFAKDEGIALPTNEEPDRDWYYGAYVFDSTVGKHRNVIYFDVSSLYPNVMYQTNMSPGTIVGTEDELAQSEYTADDCVWTYIDTRADAVKKSSEPEYEKCYFLKPSVKTGIFREIIDHLLELKDHYDENNAELYDAVKRVVNSIYGIAGDSNSYGKGFRLYNWKVAEGVTLQGRKIIQECASWATGNIDGAIVTNGDTDGVGITMGNKKSHREVVETAIETQNDMTTYIQSWCCDEFGLDSSRIEMEAEKLMDPLFVPEDTNGGAPKKRYAYNKVWEQ